MNSEFKKIPGRIERAVEWRLERFLKNRRKIYTKGINLPPKAPQFRTLWGDAWYNQPIQENRIFFESFSGNGALCNPYAIFERLLERSDFSHFEHVWALANQDLKREFDNTYRDFPNVSSVLYESAKYYESLSTSKYLINNATFQPAFTKRQGQIYINTWHGTPLKRMGYDMPGGAQGSYNILRNFVSADYILSPNKFTTDTMLRSAFRLQGVFEGKVIEEGYPRIDAQFSDDIENSATRLALDSLGLSLDPAKKLVVYAPTWKGNSFHSPKNETEKLLACIEHLEHHLGDQYQFILKVHQRVYESALNVEELSRRLVPNSVATNKVLGIADVLITDYSSIFFDFLATNRPVLFHAPDRDDYDTSRGFYIGLESLPGPTSSTVSELVEQLEVLGSGSLTDPLVSHAETYLNAREKFCSNDDGHATDRIIDVIFAGNHQERKIFDLSACSKTKLLIFLGGLKPNGITSAALNLLANIDYEKFDVSVMFPKATKHSSVKLYASVDPRVRQFLRSDTFPATESHLIANIDFLGKESPTQIDTPRLAKELLSAEWSRLFGDCRFDHIIDFSGYAGFWSYILRQGPAKTFSVWLHSNLRADADRLVDGKLINQDSLYSQFRAYENYDNLVSVSEALSEINQRELAEYAPKSKFKHVSNTLDIERIAVSSSEAQDRIFPHDGESCNGLTLGHALRSMSERFSWAEIGEAVSKVQRYDEIFPDADNEVTFITVGRLSPEKNHERLLRAFAEVNTSFPNTRLLIAGSGPMEDGIRRLIVELKLSHSVRMLGHVDDGLQLMARSDCFLMSSDYEGQPMVILEARSVNLPVISVDFGSVASVLKADEGLIVPMSVEGLVFGMTEFIENNGVPSKPFDPMEFNRLAMNDFCLTVTQHEHHI